MIHRLFITAFLILLTFGCSTVRETAEKASGQSEYENSYHVPQQFIADSSIHALQLHPVGQPNRAPIIELNSNQKLILRFEQLSVESNQFRLRVEHFKPDWESSGLSTGFFIDGFHEVTVNSGRVSTNNRTTYRQYSYEFPNPQFDITKSGNYLLHLESTDTGDPFLSIPFFVTENAGSVTSSIEVLSSADPGIQSIHRPVGRYVLPEFVEQPLFDLSFYFTQNQFWGNQKEATELDFSSPDHVQIELDRNRSFVGNIEYRRLELSDLSLGNPQVEEFFPAEKPPRVILRDDAEGLNNNPFQRRVSFGQFGRPDMDLNAGYADVVFPFDLETKPDSSAAIHLLGDFNYWTPRPENRLRYDSSADRWKTEAVVKEGIYRYKYVVVQNGRVNDLFFDDFFAGTSQQYHTFVYMYDSNRFYHRLLQVQSFFSD